MIGVHNYLLTGIKDSCEDFADWYVNDLGKWFVEDLGGWFVNDLGGWYVKELGGWYVEGLGDTVVINIYKILGIEPDPTGMDWGICIHKGDIDDSDTQRLKGIAHVKNLNAKYITGILK